MSLTETEKAFSEEVGRARDLDLAFMEVIAEEAGRLGITTSLKFERPSHQEGSTISVLVDNKHMALAIDSCHDDGGYLYTIITSAVLSGGWSRNQSISHFNYNPKFPVISFNIGLTDIRAGSPLDLRQNKDFARAISTALQNPYKQLDTPSLGMYW